MIAYALRRFSKQSMEEAGTAGDASSQRQKQQHKHILPSVEPLLRFIKMLITAVLHNLISQADRKWSKEAAWF